MPMHIIENFYKFYKLLTHTYLACMLNDLNLNFFAFLLITLLVVSISGLSLVYTYAKLIRLMHVPKLNQESVITRPEFNVLERLSNFIQNLKIYICTYNVYSLIYSKLD